VKIDATGDSYDFSPNLDFDHHRRRRNLLLGYRQVCHRPTTCKSAEVARDTDLPRRHFAASAANDGNLLGRALSAPNDRYQPTLEGHHVGISHRPLSGMIIYPLFQEWRQRRHDRKSLERMRKHFASRRRWDVLKGQRSDD